MLFADRRFIGESVDGIFSSDTQSLNMFVAVYILFPNVSGTLVIVTQLLNMSSVAVRLLK